MTMPFERTAAVMNTREFLLELMDPKKTPRVPSAVRKQAYRLLKHYPSSCHLEVLFSGASDAFSTKD